MKYELNEKTINRLPVTGKRYDIRFKGQAAKGLILRVGVNGSKTWSFVQKIPNQNEIYAATFGKVDLDAHSNIRRSNIDEALKWVVKQRKAIRKGGSKLRAKRKAKDPILFHQLYADYLKEHAVNNRRSSQRDTERLWRLHIEPEFGNVAVKKISHSDVDAFIARKRTELRAKGGTGGRSNNILALISSMMNFAKTRGYVKSNPCFGIKKIKSEHEWPELSDTQRLKLRKAAYAESDMMGLIIDFALITGARKQEILKMRWEELRGDIWRIPQGRKKGKNEHVLTLPPKLYQNLMNWRKRTDIADTQVNIAPLLRTNGFVFPSTISKLQEASRPALGDIKGPWNRIRKVAGLENFRFHDLRHDFGTQSAKAGMDIYALMNAMGHQRIETTMLYINKAGLNGQAEVLSLREQALI